MPEAQVTQPELLNFVTFLAEKFRTSEFSRYLFIWQNVIFSLVVILALCAIAYMVSRKAAPVPSGLQNAIEIFVSGVDNFICGILGPQGRRYTPFVGTLFIYILLMNLLGLVPLMKSPTSSWSTTLALALCVFIYVQYSAIRELGIRGYLDHLMDRPRGGLALSVVIPLLLLCLHIIGELVKPISLSLRLRSNIWGDEILLAIVTGFGLGGIPLLLFNTLLTIVSSLVQAVVFSLLTTIYFAIVIVHEE